MTDNETTYYRLTPLGRVDAAAAELRDLADLIEGEDEPTSMKASTLVAVAVFNALPEIIDIHGNDEFDTSFAITLASAISTAFKHSAFGDGLALRAVDALFAEARVATPQIEKL